MIFRQRWTSRVFWHGERGSCTVDLEFVETAWAAKERLRLSLMASPDGQLVERQLVQPDGMSITISTRIRGANDLMDAVASDPHRDALRVAYQRAFERHDRWSRERSETTGRTLQMGASNLDAIRATRSESRLAHLVSTVLAQRGQVPAKYIFASYQALQSGAGHQLVSLHVGRLLFLAAKVRAAALVHERPVSGVRTF